jgi:hypothetical protein
MKRTILLILVLALGQSLPLAETIESPVLELAEARRVRLPILLDELAPGGCDGISAGDLEILEDGKATPALHLEPGGRGVIHAILVDAGPRMLETIREARAAAGAYALSLPEEEELLLATFDQRLILHAPLSSDRERFTRKLQWIETGGASHLWDSAYQMIDYMSSLPGRKVLVLITDGCDSRRGGRISPGDVAAVAARTDSLTVFPIGLNLPARCPGANDDPANSLRTLARLTGGSYNAPQQLSGLAAVFDEVRARMERERFVTYRPLPFGEGPKDSPRKRKFRWRKLKPRLKEKAECRISLAASELRYESGTREIFDAKDQFSFDPDKGEISGKAVDVIRESGTVAPSLDALFDLGQHRADEGGEEVIQKRKLSVPVPALQELVRPDAKAHDAVGHALAGITSSSGDSWSRWSDVPFLVNGRTLLDLRGPMARALWNQSDYARWALERIRAERLAALDEFIGMTDAGEDRETLEKARNYLAENDWTPEPHELERNLGAWLGDIPAARAFNGAEAWMARRLLAATRESGMAGAAPAAAEAKRLWSLLSAWFPEPVDTRMIGILVPGYDPSRDTVGFYRVILRSPYSAEIHHSFVGASLDTFLGATGEGDGSGSLYGYLQTFNFSRQAPLGVSLLRWMLEQDVAGETLSRRFEVDAVMYAHPGMRDLHPFLVEQGLIEKEADPEGFLARQVTVVLTARDDPSRSVTVSGYFQQHPDSPEFLDEPMCLVTPLQTPNSASAQALWRSLISAKRTSSMPCILFPVSGR